MQRYNLQEEKLFCLKLKIIIIKNIYYPKINTTYYVSRNTKLDNVDMGK